MASSFLGLSISLSGLFANQRSLGVVSHNIANANTEGYSRQVMNTQAYKPQMLPGGMGSIGVGVDVTAIKQIRDEYLDFKYRSETSTKGEWEARSSVLSQIEGIFNEPTDSSIGKLLDNYYESLQKLSKNAEDLTARTLFRQNTIALTDGVARISNMLTQLQRDMNSQFQSSVNELNTYANQIVSLNKSIYETELEGGKANDLRDQRNVLVDKMSELVPVTYYEDEQNRFHVLIDGHLMVSHFRSESVKLVNRVDKLNESDDDKIYDVQWSNGDSFDVDTGKLAGLRDVRDNISGDQKGIPYYVSKLDEFVDVLADTMNGIHEKGYGLNGGTGYYMFTIDNMSTEEFKTYLLNKGLDGEQAVEVTSSVLDGVSGLNEEDKLKKIGENISKILMNNPDFKGKSVKLINDRYYVTDCIKSSDLTIASDLEDLNNFAAASSIEDIPGGNDNALLMVATRHNIKLYEWGSPEDYVKSLVSNLGVDSAEAKRVSSNQAQLVNEFSVSRDSVMGVSLDEEMANMIKFQTAYNASARMINVFDEMLDLLVNRLGTVGR
ncbi:flagellar hook-associated protein FlgK [Fusibacter ferrireducens]|uniref:Flagellar hook-associated protein 1 n=1 Tax=Fusibacter ferrireducens TaxID=2785058 RepID=A0ABR9ZVM0_9FIRM|nr:flagellar hook-associated protein FlgK [Fusibacter ferrireducens]MBF4694507.1 flagellar hook-associated protein FlgK [Fusibacter ferrireducens]